MCAVTAEPPTGALAGPFTVPGCPDGQSGFLVSAFLVPADQASIAEQAYTPPTVENLAAMFGVGFSIVMFFFLLGVIGHTLMRPFWASR